MGNAQSPASSPGETQPGETQPAGTQPPAGQPRLLRIQEAAAEVGLTARSVRYYEELGLLKPAARSEGDYRLFDESDLERLRFIKGLRDDAGFALAEIARLLEDQEVRERGHAAYHATTDPAERSRILAERVATFDRQIETLRQKIARLEGMVEDAEGRRVRTLERMAELKREPAVERAGGSARAGGREREGADGSEAVR